MTPLFLLLYNKITGWAEGMDLEKMAMGVNHQHPGFIIWFAPDALYPLAYFPGVTAGI
jgi:hypothetical protein